jgi:penicillin-insensitive murein DD-endopeptidase
MISKILIGSILIFSQIVFADESICYGETKNGKLENGVKLPNSGENFITYSYVASTMGRTYVHSKVKSVFLDAYKNLEKSMPDKVYKFAETGFQDGGSFKPHKTHQNGLSIDFMVPVINEKGESVHFSTSPLNKFGYSVEFTKNGKLDDLTIDFEALAAHIVELHKASIKNKIRIWRVIFDPKLQPKLFKTKYGSYLRKHIKFNKKRSWVRHDEHYHVDFKVKCKQFKKEK